MLLDGHTYIICIYRHTCILYTHLNVTSKQYKHLDNETNNKLRTLVKENEFIALMGKSTLMDSWIS